MIGNVLNGTEHGVEWMIDERKFDPILITVKSINTGKGETVSHKCYHRPLFGYDVGDVQAVEDILDKLIVKYANDGYKAK